MSWRAMAEDPERPPTCERSLELVPECKRLGMCDCPYFEEWDE